MARFPSFNFPNQTTQASGAFSPAQIDFSKISQIADSYYDAQDGRLKRDAFQEQQAAARDDRAARAQLRTQGLPRDAQGNFDPSAAAEQLWRLGEFDKATGIVSSQQPKLSENQKLYQQAKEQGFQGTIMDFLQTKAGFSRPQTNINMPKIESKYDETLGKSLAEEFVNANTSAATAQRDLANLDVMMQALNDPNLYTSSGGNLIQGVKKGAETLFGVPVKGTSSGEILQNLASEIAVSNKDKLPGPMSDADRQFLVDMAPNLTKTPEGNRLIIELGMAHKRWQAARGQAARDYAARNGGRLDGNYYAFVGELDSKAAQEFSTFLSRMRGMGQMAPRSPAAGTNLNPGTYNWSPNGGFQEAR